MSRPTRRDDISRDVEAVFSIAVKASGGPSKLRTKSNIRRMIAWTDASGESNRRGACSCTSVDRSVTVARRFGAIHRTLSGMEGRA